MLNQGSSELDTREEAEKKLIREYFDNKAKGFFVEVGANEPVSPYSQSWHLENVLGWSGILIEPNPVLAEQAKSNRPKSTVYQCACVSSETQGDLPLYIPLIDNTEVSGHAALGKNIDDFSYKNHKEVKVHTRTLNSILEELSVAQIDLLSIDVEGAELEVLYGFDIQKYKPNLILLEDKHVYLSKHRLLKKNGYELAKRTTLNCWYIPVGAKKPHQTFNEKIKLLKRMYLSIWLKKIKLAIRTKSLEPFKTL